MALARIGQMSGAPGLTAAERRPSLASIMPGAGQGAAVSARLEARFGVSAPRPGKVSHGEMLSIAWAGPDGWLAIAAGVGDLEDMSRDALGGHAAVADLSDGRCVLRIAGPKARDLLMKGVAIDLHPRAFQTSDTAITLLGHISVQIIQASDEPAYDLIFARSVAEDVWHWLAEAGGEYGIALDPGPD
jgi:sarcosine oxidase subunit gamma